MWQLLCHLTQQNMWGLYAAQKSEIPLSTQPLVAFLLCKSCSFTHGLLSYFRLGSIFPMTYNISQPSYFHLVSESFIISCFMVIMRIMRKKLRYYLSFAIPFQFTLSIYRSSAFQPANQHGDVGPYAPKYLPTWSLYPWNSVLLFSGSQISWFSFPFAFWELVLLLSWKFPDVSRFPMLAPIKSKVVKLTGGYKTYVKFACLI